jgi:hypothetical protein
MVMEERSCQLKQIHELPRQYHCHQYLLFYGDAYGDVCVSLNFVFQLKHRMQFFLHQDQLELGMLGILGPSCLKGLEHGLATNYELSQVGVLYPFCHPESNLMI